MDKITPKSVNFLSSDGIFHLFAQTVSNDYTVASTVNALSVGPVSVDDGVTVTVEDGGIWTIV
jgi:hypothetical protein